MTTLPCAAGHLFTNGILEATVPTESFYKSSHHIRFCSLGRWRRVSELQSVPGAVLGVHLQRKPPDNSRSFPGDQAAWRLFLGSLFPSPPLPHHLTCLITQAVLVSHYANAGGVGVVTAIHHGAAAGRLFATLPYLPTRSPEFLTYTSEIWHS